MATAAAMLVARLTTVVLQLSRGRVDPVDFALAIFKSGLLIPSFYSVVVIGDPRT
jgi:hypothetical protein